jgi:long-chain acyl-CoA synthetase
VSPTATDSEAKALVEAAGAQFVAAPVEDMLAEAINVPIEMTRVADEGGQLWRVARPARLLDTVPWTPNGVLVRQYSSGSTGGPKHMFKTEANVAIDLQSFRDAVGIGADDVFLGALPFHATGGARTVNAALSVGGAISVLPRFLPGAALEAARRDGVSVFMASPAMIEALASCRLEPGDDQAFRRLRLCMVGGALVQRAQNDAFVARFGVPVRTWYGSTETYCVAIDFEDDFEEGRVGRPLPHVEVAAFDTVGNRLPDGEIGEVGIRGPTACAGYIDDPEASARAFRNGWVFPGDRGRLDARGRLYVLGRGDVINIGGYKVDPLEVERAIRESLPVGEVVVVPGTRAGLPAVRAVVEADPARVTPAMVVAACRARLSPYKVPAEIEVRARLPRDGSGKVVKSSLDPA